MTIVRTEPAVTACGGCGTGLAPSLLSCPACHRLVHSERLKELAARAETARLASLLRLARASGFQTGKA